MVRPQVRRAPKPLPMEAGPLLVLRERGKPQGTLVLNIELFPAPIVAHLPTSQMETTCWDGRRAVQCQRWCKTQKHFMMHLRSFTQVEKAPTHPTKF